MPLPFRISDTMYEDEDSRLFLSMLDATAERIFEACAEIMATESIAIAVACDTETVHQSTRNCLQQGDGSCSQLNTLSSASLESSYHNQSRKRRKRSWTTDKPVLEETSSATQTNLNTNENTCAFDWPQTFAFSSYVPDKPFKEFKAKKSFTLTKNFKQRERKGAPRSNAGSPVNNLLRGAMLSPIVGIDGKCETENTEKFDDFSKEIHEAIDRIASLIPSLQKLANGVELPINQQNAGKLELRNNSYSTSEDDQMNRLRMTKVLEVTENNVANAGKYNPKQPREQAVEKDKRLRFQTPVPSIGSSSFRRPKKISSFDKSDRKADRSHAKEKRMSRVRHSIHRTCSRRESRNGASQRKITRHNQISEETSWSSPSTSCGTSIPQRGYPSSLSGSYLSTGLDSGGSDETVSGYEKVRQSSRKWSDLSQSNTDYDTFSDYSSQDWYSDISPSSQGNSESFPRWEDHRVERGKTVGRISKLRKKLGTIFHHHHHHHHHHHYNDKDDSDLGHVGLFKRLGKFFHGSERNDAKRVKNKKPQKPGKKSVVKKKHDIGHFRTLVDGLMRHKRHSKKSKKVKGDTEILVSGRNKSHRAKKKLRWFPKMGRGKVKVPDKGKVKLKRVATKTAKMILN